MLAGFISWSNAARGAVRPASTGASSTPTTEATSARRSAFAKLPPLAESVVQHIRVDDQFVSASAKVHWDALQDQMLPVLSEPAVLTRIVYPTNALTLIQMGSHSQHQYVLRALQDGAFDIQLHYQLHTTTKDGGGGFALPTSYGLVNRVTLTLTNRDVDVESPAAVSIEPVSAGATNQTTVNLVLSPVNHAWIGWKPRSRDVKREKPVFYAEIVQLYVPAAGVIEGAHQVHIRPAQGELSELALDVPVGATITDVVEPVKQAPSDSAKTARAAGSSTSLVSTWRFDPDTRKLRVSLTPAQSKPFSILIRSQMATGPLPFEQSVGLVSVNGAAGQIGLLGVATGPEVQLDEVRADAFSSINLEDFPTALVETLQSSFPGLTLRRAYRSSDVHASALLKASPVEPDVRVETQETLSLGEDRTVLADTLNVAITRAGIFRLSFVLPAGLDVESISGQALSHWTDLKTPDGRVITLHLRGKTLGQQQFSISLVGPGVKPIKSWTVPRLVLREASKQRGQLLVVPEQGMRLQVSTRDGVTQVDPKSVGFQQKGVLAFRLLHGQWKLVLDIEQVAPWVQVTSLQHATVNEAQVKVTANLQYEIENTGLKTLHVLIPTNADSVRFRGEQIADFLPVAGAITNELQTWDIKLHRRIIGPYLLQVTYQTLIPEKASTTLLDGVQAVGVNLQRGFVTVQSDGRLQLRADKLPAALQPADWQSIPRALRQDMPAAPANFTYRLVESNFQLALQIERHEATKLLPARVNHITLTSVISDAGVMLTHVQIEMIPGDKRLLHLTLPSNAHFWFAFVNQNGVWPWQEKEQILIPLEQQSKTTQAITVELFYSSRPGTANPHSLNLDLLGPQFDLPLENITWKVYLSEKWDLAEWSGSLQLQGEQVQVQPVSVNIERYLQKEATLQREKTKEAEQMLEKGNDDLQRGEPQQARRAYQAAYGLSQGDSAFNEDARVQLHNLKLQQALLGLNVRQAAVGGETSALAGKLRDLRSRKGAAYTQDEAKQIIEQNSAEENAVFMRLAERLIQQQDAAVAQPIAIRASIPEQGRLLTFTRLVQVNTWADLNIQLRATAAQAASSATRILVLLAVFAVLITLALIARALFGRPNRASM